MVAQPLPRQVSRQREYQLRFPEREAARRTVHAAVKAGALRPANNYRCVDCGQQAAEYDHYLGYDPEFHLVVHPVCVPCHGRRPRSPRSPATRRRPLAPPVRQACAGGCGKSRIGIRPYSCFDCRKGLPVIEPTCDVCHRTFVLRGKTARCWLNNRKDRQRKTYCPDCWGSQTDYRAKRLAKQRQPPEPEPEPAPAP